MSTDSLPLPDSAGNPPTEPNTLARWMNIPLERAIYIVEDMSPGQLYNFEPEVFTSYPDPALVLIAAMRVVRTAEKRGEIALSRDAEYACEMIFHRQCQLELSAVGMEECIAAALRGDTFSPIERVRVPDPIVVPSDPTVLAHSTPDFEAALAPYIDAIVVQEICPDGIVPMTYERACRMFEGYCAPEELPTLAALLVNAPLDESQQAEVERNRKRIEDAYRDRSYMANVRQRAIARYRMMNPSVSTRKRDRKGGFVYVLRSPTGAYKIGRTGNPNDRLRTFSVKLPFEVEYEMVFKTEDMHGFEAALHDYFDDKRINGEWFALTEADLVELRKIGGAE